MPQLTLFAPDITCDHCIATIKKTAETVDGVRFVEGNPDAKAFIVDLARGAALDSLAEALASEGYPLGPAAIGASHATHAAHEGMTMLDMASPAAEGFTPSYRVEKTAAGADVHYNCPCGSEDEVFHLDRSKAEQAPHSCCGHHMLAAPNAAERLRAMLGDGYAITVTDLEMPWGQPMQAAFAVSR